MVQDSGNPPDRKPPQGPGRTFPGIPSKLVVRLPKAERPQTFTKIFRWRLPAGQKQEPATVEVVGTFTKWQKVPLVRDDARRTWQVTLHDVPCNRTHRYMLLVDGKPVRDEHCDGLAIPSNSQEAQYQLMTTRGPRVLMLFAQTK
ncbi:MAG: glycogen-binding domain-containing protein [Verrucomicrobiota bacterium]|jgi:hypothetical protein